PAEKHSYMVDPLLSFLARQFEMPLSPRHLERTSACWALVPETGITLLQEYSRSVCWGVQSALAAASLGRIVVWLRASLMQPCGTLAGCAMSIGWRGIPSTTRRNRESFTIPGFRLDAGT